MSEPKIKQTSPAILRRGAFLFFVAVVVLTGIIAGYVPLFNDDLYYACIFSCEDHTFCPEKHFNLWDELILHRAVANGRFGDMFITLFVLIPAWAYGVLYAVGYGGIILMMSRIAGISFRSNPIKSTWLVGLTVLFFPWCDLMFSRSVFLNYFPSALIMLYVVSVFISEKEMKGYRLAISIILSVLAGWWHELVPMILFPAAITYCAITRKISRNQIIIAGAIAGGFLMTISAPSFFNRVDQLDELGYSFSYLKFTIFFTTINLIMALAAIVTTYIEKKPRREKALAWAFAVPLIPSEIITATSVLESRMLLFSTILIFISFMRNLPSAKAKIRPILIGVTVAASCLIMVHLVLLLQNTRKVYLASKEILAQATSYPDENIYFDLSSLLDRPEIFYLYKSVALGYSTQYTVTKFGEYTHRKSGFRVVPPIFKDFDSSKAKKLDSPSNIYCVGDYFLATDAPFDPMDYIRGDIQIEYDSGENVLHSFIGYYFKDKTGKPLIHLLITYPLGKRGKPIRAGKIIYYP